MTLNGMTPNGTTPEPDEILEQPMFTDEGFVNQACLNELDGALDALPATHIRLAGNSEWSTPRITSKKEIMGAFSKYAVIQSPYAFPEKLENVLGYLYACLTSEFGKDYFKAWSLCDINRKLHEILMDEELFTEWNERKNGKQGTGFSSLEFQPSPADDFIDLHALLHNVCLDIRMERRAFDAFNKKFEDGETYVETRS